MEPYTKIIRELYEEKARLERAIAALEEMEALGSTLQSVRKRRGRKSMGAEERREVSERMKRYWASRRSSKTDNRNAPSKRPG